MDVINPDSDLVTKEIIGSAIAIHKALGPGLLESTYAACMAHELSLRNLRFTIETDIPVSYKGIKLATGYRADMVVEHQVIVELKAVSKLEPVFHAQLLTYMKLSCIRRGLLINFNVPVLKDGIKRIVL